MDGYDARICLGWIVDVHGVAEGRGGVKKMIAPGSKRDPFVIGSERGEVGREAGKGFVYSKGGTRLPFLERLPGGLEGADDALFKVSRVLLHDDDGFLEEVFFVDLFLELASDGLVSYITK
jgi:hypothetical protein